MSIIGSVHIVIVCEWNLAGAVYFDSTCRRSLVAIRELVSFYEYWKLSVRQLSRSPLGSILTNNRIITWKTMFRKTPKTGSGEYFISTRAIPDILFLKV